MDTRKLSRLQRDALKEVANIGSGHAATSLSELINKRVMIRAPKCLTGTLENVIFQIRDPNDVVASVVVSFLGDLVGKALVVFPFVDAKRLMKLLIIEQVQDTHEVRESLLKEVSNMLFCSYINALGEMLGFLILPSVPDMTVDMAGTVLSNVISDIDNQDDFLFCIETEFWLEDTDETFRAYMIFLPNAMSCDVILKELKVEK